MWKLWCPFDPDASCYGCSHRFSNQMQGPDQGRPDGLETWPFHFPAQTLGVPTRPIVYGIGYIVTIIIIIRDIYGEDECDLHNPT